MPTWKQKNEIGGSRFCHLCERCNERLDDALLAEGWILVRDGEPVSCSECSLRCALTAQELWGAADAIRYAACEACPDITACALKGRYFC